MTGKDLPRQRPRAAIKARTINELERTLERQGRGQTLAGFGLGLDRRASRAQGRGFYARLSGSSSPYAFAEVYGKLVAGALTWVDVPSGRTGLAHSENGLAGLSGKVARLEWVPRWGAARFGFNRKGCKWTITLGGCGNTPLAGETVELKQSGATIASGTTNGSGVVVLNVPPGTYDIVATDTAGYGYATSTTTGVSHTCDQSTTIVLTGDPDHICTLCCTNLIPKTLNGTYAGGAFTVTYDAASGKWKGSGVFAGIAVTARGVDCSGPMCADGGTGLNVQFEMDCGPNGLGGYQFNFRMIWGCLLCHLMCPDIPTSFYSNDTTPPAGGTTAKAASSPVPSPCSPFFIQFQFSADPIPPPSPCSETPGGTGVAHLITITA